MTTNGNYIGLYSTNGLLNIQADSLECETFMSQPSTYFTGLSNNIQTQINAIDTAISTNIPTFSIGTVTASTYPNVTISGTTSNPVLNFALVPGQNGVNGQKGDKGDRGPEGPRGPADTAGFITGLGGVVLSGVSLGVSAMTAMGLFASVTSEGVAEGGIIGGIETEIASMQGEIDELQGKTMYMQQTTIVSAENLETPTSAFNSELWIGSTLNPSRLRLSQYGDITTSGGNITVKNNAGSTTATIGQDGSITASSINTQTATFGVLNTNQYETQNIKGATINIGTNGGNSIYIGNYNSVVYVNNVPLVPWSSASSFFNQW